MTVLIVGAGMAGLTAARQVAAADEEVIVLERGRSPGGRLATRRLGPAVFDVGAQFFTVRSGELAADVARWQAEGLVYEWNRGFGQPPDGHPRYSVRGGMQALAGRLAAGLVVRLGVEVRAVRPAGPGWEVRWDGGGAGADAVVLTPPGPPVVALLDGGGVAVPPTLARLRWAPVLAALAVLDRPSAVPPPGGVQLDEGPFSLVADNAAKGISPVPAVTLHASAEESRRRWHEPDAVALAALLTAGRRWLGSAAVLDAALVRWPWATPLEPLPERCLDVAPGLVCAGDAFAGPRVEGAYLSGRAAASSLLTRVSPSSRSSSATANEKRK